ncbi:MAG: NYN domain-containing protein, partial [Alicyclobacillus sp.]|nr:NYN domain-containing protein [Alicyclobacillus sp.]
RTAEPERVYEQSGVQVVFTAAGETADAYIERRVYELRGLYRQIAVATSDAAEQQVAFGGGALRLSANGLLQLLADAKQGVQGAIAQSPLQPRGTVRDRIGKEIANVLEKWRRQGRAGD